jgi:ornithine cyclodeaminase/alanine dehydrogenase-like protein (mu-crystallin family)
VHSRSEERRSAFVARLDAELAIPVVSAPSAQAAVEGADIVVLATTSYRPVISAEWLKPGAFVHSVGFKSPVAKEAGFDVVERAGIIVTDSPAQVEAAGRTFILYGTPHLRRLADLAGFVSARGPVRIEDDAIVLCYPMGLAGTEVVIANDILCRWRAESGTAA